MQENTTEFCHLYSSADDHRFQIRSTLSYFMSPRGNGNRVNEHTCSSKRVYKNVVNRTGSWGTFKMLEKPGESKNLLSIILEGDKAFISDLNSSKFSLNLTQMIEFHMIRTRWRKRTGRDLSCLLCNSTYPLASPGGRKLSLRLFFILGSPLQRPTAKELLKHKFIVKHCKKTSYLSELIDRYRRWKEEGHSDSSSDDSDRCTIALHSQSADLKWAWVTLVWFVCRKWIQQQREQRVSRVVLHHCQEEEDRREKGLEWNSECHSSCDLFCHRLLFSLYFTSWYLLLSPQSPDQMSKSASLTTVISPVFTEVRMCKSSRFSTYIRIENGINVLFVFTVVRMLRLHGIYVWFNMVSHHFQLKQQHKEHSEQRLAIEELERNIRLAEEVCPGITDRMVSHIIARYQK